MLNKVFVNPNNLMTQLGFSKTEKRDFMRYQTPEMAERELSDLMARSTEQRN